MWRKYVFDQMFCRVRIPSENCTVILDVDVIQFISNYWS